MKMWILTAILLLSLMLVAWIELEIFPLIPSTVTKPDRINSIIVNFSSAYISSYCFYLLVVYIKERKDRKNSVDYVFSNCNKIVGHGKALMETINKTGGTNFIGSIPLDDLNKILVRVQPGDEVADHRRLYNLTWENYLKEISNDTRTSIDRILALIPYLDSDLVRLLTKIYDSKFLTLSTIIASSELLKKLPIPINMTMYSSLIQEYFQQLAELESYVNANLKSTSNQHL
jgi:hypothetical protein